MWHLSGLTPELLSAAAWILAFGVLVCSRDVPLRFALPVALAKVAVPVAYFAGNPMGAFHVLDDLFYYNSALGMLQRGYDLVTLIRDPVAFQLYLPSMTGSHIGYHLWNLSSLSVFGPYYFSPVLMNVGATFVAGFFFFRILRLMDFPEFYSRCALVFFLLHWDVVAWSSFLNMKDVLVMTLTLALLHQVLLAALRPSAWRLAGVALAMTPLLFLRFYAPALVLAAALLYLALSGRVRLAAVTAAGLAFGLYLRVPGIAAAWAHLDLSAVTGLPRFLMTPLPWNLTPGYEFLLLPSALHLLLLLPALAVIPRLWREHPHSRLMLLYFAVALASYAIAPSLQGVRQRFQVGFVLAWLQFHALWRLMGHAALPGKSAARPATPAPASAIDPAGAAR
jgi:hypothetical protein